MPQWFLILWLKARDLLGLNLGAGVIPFGAPGVVPATDPNFTYVGGVIAVAGVTAQSSSGLSISTPIGATTGAITITPGQPNSAGASPGLINIIGGTAQNSGGGAGSGGGVTIKGGAATAAGLSQGGAINVTGGAGSASNGVLGGIIAMTTGAGSGSGAMTFKTGLATGTGSTAGSGAISFTTGNSTGYGAGGITFAVGTSTGTVSGILAGSVGFTAGSANGSTGTGGSVSFTAGAAAGSGGTPGNVNLTPGLGASSATAGYISLKNPVSGKGDMLRLAVNGSGNTTLGVFNATPIAQPTTASAASAFVAGAGTAVTDASTFDGYTLKQIVAALRGLGLLA